jgi:hypothetical protein
MTDKDNAWVEPTICKILDIRDRYAASILAARHAERRQH